LVLCGQNEAELNSPTADSTGLISLLRDHGDGASSLVANLSAAAGALLRWSVSQLRMMKASMPAECGTREAQRRQEETQDSLRKFGEQEAYLLQKVLVALADTDGGRDRTSKDACTVQIVTETKIKFSKGGALMSSLAARPLAGILEVLKQQPDLVLNVLGCRREDEDETLALKRARLVVKYFHGQGIPVGRFAMLGIEGEPCVQFGIAEPILLPDRITFGACSDALSPDAEAALESVAALSTQVPFLHISVAAGHADSSAGYSGVGNTALSQARAERVAAHLRALGMSGDRLEVVPQGDSCPRASNEDSEEKAASCRVELYASLEKTARHLRLACQSCVLVDDQGPLFKRRSEQARAVLLQLAFTAAGVFNNGNVSADSAQAVRTSLEFGLRRVAAEALCSRGVHWGHKLLSRPAWT
jgi:outer membrane protein OmpA-like peptidoglycan-associated protein